jgi:hypothetical protein
VVLRAQLARRVRGATLAEAVVVTATNGNGARQVGELVAEWAGIRMAEVDDLVAEARAKVATIPDRRVLFTLLGELVIRVAALELEVAELRKAAQ